MGNIKKRPEKVVEETITRITLIGTIIALFFSLTFYLSFEDSARDSFTPENYFYVGL